MVNKTELLSGMMRFMNEKIMTKPLEDAVELHRFITKAYFGMDELLMIYAATPLTDYLKHDSRLGGYIPRSKKPSKKHLPKMGYFI